MLISKATAHTYTHKTIILDCAPLIYLIISWEWFGGKMQTVLMKVCQKQRKSKLRHVLGFFLLNEPALL